MSGQKSTDYTCAQRRSVADVRWKKALTTHAHSAGQWPMSGEKKHWLHMHTAQVSGQCQVKKSTDYTCTQRRSVANVRWKKHWLHMHTVQVSGWCRVKKALTTHAHSAGQWPMSGEKKHWLHMHTAQVSGQCQVKKKALTTHVCRSMASFRDGSALKLTREKSQ